MCFFIDQRGALPGTIVRLVFIFMITYTQAYTSHLSHSFCKSIETLNAASSRKNQDLRLDSFTLIHRVMTW